MISEKFPSLAIEDIKYGQIVSLLKQGGSRISPEDMDYLLDHINEAENAYIHLSQEELNELILHYLLREEPDSDITAHIEGCAKCRDKISAVLNSDQVTKRKAEIKHRFRKFMFLSK